MWPVGMTRGYGMLGIIWALGIGIGADAPFGICGTDIGWPTVAAPGAWPGAIIIGRAAYAAPG